MVGNTEIRWYTLLAMEGTSRGDGISLVGEFLDTVASDSIDSLELYKLAVETRLFSHLFSR